MNIIGHQKIINLLDKAIAKEAVSHAYLFSGPEAVGKFAVAREFAKKLGVDLTGADGDFILIRPESEESKGVIRKKDIKIEKIRELQHQLGLSSANGKFKVTIIDDADRLNKIAQNALLKTLEEAHEQNVVILVVQDEKKILPTIQSRCQRIKFGTVAAAEIEKNIASEARRERVIFWSLGRPGIMKRMEAENQELEIREESLEQLRKIFKLNIQDKFALAEEWSKDVNLLTEKINFWLIVMRAALLGNLSLAVEQKKILILLEEMEKSLKIMRETNSNPRLALENLLLKF